MKLLLLVFLFSFTLSNAQQHVDSNKVHIVHNSAKPDSTHVGWSSDTIHFYGNFPIRERLSDTSKPSNPDLRFGTANSESLNMYEWFGPGHPVMWPAGGISVAEYTFIPYTSSADQRSSITIRLALGDTTMVIGGDTAAALKNLSLAFYQYVQKYSAAKSVLDRINLPVLQTVFVGDKDFASKVRAYLKQEHLPPYDKPRKKK